MCDLPDHGPNEKSYYGITYRNEGQHFYKVESSFFGEFATYLQDKNVANPHDEILMGRFFQALMQGKIMLPSSDLPQIPAVMP